MNMDGPGQNSARAEISALPTHKAQTALRDLTIEEWGLLSAASYYADKNGPEGRATNHQAYRQSYLEAMAGRPFEIIASLNDRMPGVRHVGGAAIVAFKDRRTGNI